MVPASPARAAGSEGLLTAGLVVLVGALSVSGYFLAGDPGRLAPPGGGGVAPPTVYVTSILWSLRTSGCSGDGTVYAGAGYLFATGSSISLSELLVNTAGAGTCTFTDPEITRGFTVISSNTPLTVAAGGRQLFEMTMQVPSTAWTGALSVSLSVTMTT